MSRSIRAWALLALTSLLAGLGVTPASATDWNPPPPTPSDVCGTKQDRFYVPIDDQTDYHYRGQIVGQGRWHPTDGTANANVVAKTWSDPDKTFTMTFGVEANSTCVEAVDTVATEVVTCNTQNNGTRVTFTYTNGDDATDWWRTRPAILVNRWDSKQSAYVVPTYGRVHDGQQASITGGDTAEGGSGPADFFLAPGTYSLKLSTNESSAHFLPNRLFVPACGDYVPPPGDPMGGPIPGLSNAKAAIKRCRDHRVKVVLDSTQTTEATRYRVIIDPRRGSTKTRAYTVDAEEYKTVILTRQKSGTVVKVRFVGKVVKRKLAC